jgi:hypothetical protein
MLRMREEAKAGNKEPLFDRKSNFVRQMMDRPTHITYTFRKARTLMKTLLSDKTMPHDDRQEKREIRLKIGRMRRRLDARAQKAIAEGRTLVSWRTYAGRHPAAAIATAFGLGLSGAAVFSSNVFLKKLGAALLRGSYDRALRLIGQELLRRWKSTGGKP